jgi:hypothetical protein
MGDFEKVEGQFCGSDSSDEMMFVMCNKTSNLIFLNINAGGGSAFLQGLHINSEWYHVSACNTNPNLKKETDDYILPGKQQSPIIVFPSDSEELNSKHPFEDTHLPPKIWT